MSTPATPPSGESFDIAHGAYAASFVEVGGGLRTLTHEGRDVVSGFPADGRALSSRGQVLIPWPNRIRDGRYTFDGVEQELARTEPKFDNASHGLVRFALWQRDAGRSDARTLVLTNRLRAQQGWVACLDLTATWSLGDDGLTVTQEAVNVGTSPAPFGYGVHPYIALGGRPMEQVRITVPATHWVEVDERKLPVATREVAGTELDLRAGEPLGSRSLDTAYTGLDRGADGRWVVRLENVGAGTVEVWGDEALGWTQVFNGQTKPVEDGITGIAVEPMSCPSDAFNSGTDLVRLEPGQRWRARWGIRVA